MKSCPFCGEKIEEAARFCHYCMTSLEEKQVWRPIGRKRGRWQGVLAAFLALVCVATAVETVGGAVPPPTASGEDGETRTAAGLANAVTITSKSAQTTAVSADTADRRTRTGTSTNTSPRATGTVAGTSTNTSPRATDTVAATSTVTSTVIGPALPTTLRSTATAETAGSTGSSTSRSAATAVASSDTATPVSSATTTTTTTTTTAFRTTTVNVSGLTPVTLPAVMNSADLQPGTRIYFRDTKTYEQSEYQNPDLYLEIVGMNCYYGNHIGDSYQSKHYYLYLRIKNPGEAYRITSGSWLLFTVRLASNSTLSFQVSLNPMEPGAETSLLLKIDDHTERTFTISRHVSYLFFEPV